jgi:hypothetical protein
MPDHNTRSSMVLGLFIFLGLASLGYLVSESILKFKEFERVVTVKGLAEMEVPADIAIWPIKFTRASNDVTGLYAQLEQDKERIVSFLRGNGFDDSEITIARPAVIDRMAQQYGDGSRAEFRYVGSQGLSIYTEKIQAVRAASYKLAELGKAGVVLGGEDYETRTQYIFSGLNEIKPKMIEDATTNARQVAEKFAMDSLSSLGKIKSANQGQFSIEDRDGNTPYIKKVRVVSTLQYYLSD